VYIIFIIVHTLSVSGSKAGGDRQSIDYNKKSDVNNDRRAGNSAENAERRLRKDRSDLHARVPQRRRNASMLLTGELLTHSRA
jgi:hypothetical protein